MFEEFIQAAKSIFEKAQHDGRLIRNPDTSRLRLLALEEPEVRESRYGSLAVDSEPTSRAAMFTKNNIDSKFGKPEYDLLEAAKAALEKTEIVSIDVQVGDGTEGVTARLIVPRRFAHVAFAGLKLFKPTTTEEPTYQVIMFTDDAFESNKSKKLPNKDITIRLAHDRRTGRMVKIVRNSNYFGEWKKGVFAGENFRVKQNGNAVFLHVGCRRDTLETPHGQYHTTCSLFAALSANGKTSTTCKVLARKGRERSWLIQDDGGSLHRDGSFRGFEPGGIFVKTDGLNPGDQLEAYYASLKRETFLENVWIEPDGAIDFFNMERTSNGRAVIERRDFMHAAQTINSDRVDNLFLITRGNIIPAIAKLTHEQAAAFMVLGQSMESSAGDPTQAGKIKNCFFYDPFLAGDRAEHANLFYDILKANSHIQCYLLNTGFVGEGESMRDIRLADTMGILDSVLRGGLDEWVFSPRTKLHVPAAVRLVDSILFHPEKLFPHDVFEERQKALEKHRAEYVDQFPGLHPEIRKVFQP